MGLVSSSKSSDQVGYVSLSVASRTVAHMCLPIEQCSLLRLTTGSGIAELYKQLSVQLSVALSTCAATI